jgi:hypothetical protein
MLLQPGYDVWHWPIRQWLVGQDLLPSPQSAQAMSGTGQSLSVAHLVVHMSRSVTHLPPAQYVRLQA